VVPHIAARETHQRSWKNLAGTPKRLLQQYRRFSDLPVAMGGCPLSKVEAEVTRANRDFLK
jgi:hypothetical protein